MNDEPKPKLAWLRDADWQFARALANLWLWGSVMDADNEHPSKNVMWVYPEHLALGGPHSLKGKRIQVTLEIVDMP